MKLKPDAGDESIADKHLYTPQFTAIAIAPGYEEGRMVDFVSKSKRSRMMAAVKSSDTRPEIVVRSVAHQLGLRFRLHQRNLPGKPDLVFPKWKTVVFVHGCFWHQHPGCDRATVPSSNRKFWQKKFQKNKERDAKNLSDLIGLGWRPEIIWECETKSRDQVTDRLKEIFELTEAPNQKILNGQSKI